MSGETDPEIVIRLPLSQLTLVVQHLYLGLYMGNPVHEIVKAITDQANPQIVASANLCATTSEPGASPERLN
jgi:hypothetical protein